MKINLLLLAIVVIAGGIRLIRLEDKVLWLDEQHTVLEANGISEQVSLNLKEGFTVTDYKREKDIKHIARAVVERDSGNGIIYAYGMALWTGVFNNSSYSIRLVSVIFSLLTTGLLFYLGRDLFNSPAVGYWSAILFSIHHVAILKAQEARAYSMATFFIMLSVMLFFRLIDSKCGTRVWQGVPYGLCAGIALLTHYFTFFVVLSEIFIALLFCRTKNGWKGLVLGGFVAGLILMSWMFNGGTDGLEFMEMRNNQYQEASLLDPTNSFYGEANSRTITAGFFQMITHIAGIGFQNTGLRILETIPFLLLPAAIFFLTLQSIAIHRKIFLLLFIIIFSAPLVAVILAITSGHTVSLQTLYTSFSIPCACLFLGALFHFALGYHTWSRRILVALYLLVIISSSVIVICTDSHGSVTPETDWEAIAIGKESRYLPGDTLIHNSSQQAMLLNLYFRNPSMVQKVVE